MPLCALSAAMVTRSGEPVGYMDQGGFEPEFLDGEALFLVPIPDWSSCAHIVLSPTEYKDLQGGVIGGDVNVTADIFIGCLLVLCLIGGWIAGGQR